MNMKKLLLLLSLAFATGAWAVPDFSPYKKYHIVCSQFSSGCVTDGATAGQTTPLYHLPELSKGDETYWLFSDEGNGYFTIRNVKTGKYVTYDGVRQDTPQLRRYVSMTDNMDGDNSLWTFVVYSEGVYAIRNAAHSDHLWDVRVDSYCVGTYSRTETPNWNQQFFFIDDAGNQVVEKHDEPPVESGTFDVSSWLVATAEAADGWTFDSGAWSDPGFGAYQSGDASIVSPFLEQWHDAVYGPLANNVMSQTLYNLPQGDYRLTADIIAVRQESNWGRTQEEVGHSVFLFANDEMQEAGTHNNEPRRYAVDFSLTGEEELTLGLSIDNTNANWVATDNFCLYFNGTEKELIDGEKAKVRAELGGFIDRVTLEQMIAQCNDDFNALEELRLGPKGDPLSYGLKNLTIDGQSLAWVESLELYLVSIPEEYIGKAYSAVIDYEAASGWSQLTIGGKTVAPGDTYNFTSITAGKTFTFTVKNTDGSATHSCRVTFTALPVVRINGSFNNSYSDGSIQVYEPAMGYPAEMLSMKAKWRGGITNGQDKHKRNYHVKLKDELGNKLEKKFFGLRNDNSWILESCQVDMSRVRNRVLTDLWNDFSTPPYYKELEKKARTGTRGQFVELILNGEYRGIYCMTENMDRKQMQLKKADENAEGGLETTHGQLWKAKDWSFAVFMGPNRGHYYPADFLTTPDENNSMWDKYEVKYPDFEDYGYVTEWDVLYDAVNFVCYSDDDTFRNHVAEYFDVPVFMDYYILMETILATDNHGKNQFFAVYDKQEDKKITFSVWDMDATCGQRWSDQYYHWNGMRPEQDYARYIYNEEHGENNLYKRLRDTDADDFNMKMRLRYRDLRKNYLATDSILKRFSTYLNTFKRCGAAAREYNKWNGDSDIYGLNLNFDTEMAYLTDWFTKRMDYLDTKRFDIASLPEEEPLKGDVNGDGTVDVADISTIISVMAGSATSAEADVNGDGSVDVADISTVISVMAGISK